MTTSDPLSLIGQTIDDKYVVESFVGEGGFAVVYRALHKMWKRPVAIKFFRSLMDAAPAMRDELLANFVQEGALLTELSARCAAVVQARDIGTFTRGDEWIPYMVLEWLEGASLETVLERENKPMELARVVDLLTPVAEALAAAHARAIAHRDVKPANIFVLSDDSRSPGTTPIPRQVHVKLLDFGIAKVVQSVADLGYTKTGGHVTSFTPAYGAPEQFSRTRGATGPWTDVYALALVFVEMLSGRPALEGEDFIQLGMSSADENRRPTPRTIGVAVNDDVEACLHKALAVKPTDRYSSASEFWAAMRAAAGMPAMSVSLIAPASARSHAALAATEIVSSATTASVSKEGSTLQQGTTPISVVGLESRRSESPRKAGWLVPTMIAAGALVIAAVSVALLLPLRGANSAPKPSAAASQSASISAQVSASSAPSNAPAPCPPDMAKIPGGKFFMGTDNGNRDEQPAHSVALSRYCIDKTLVTVTAYKACSDVGECKRASAVVDWPDVTDRQKKIYTPLCNINDYVGRANHPINCVDWQMAVSYCEYKKRRLPTEAEFEFAARGPDGRIYPWGDEPPDETRLNACGKECVEWGKNVGERVMAMYPGDDGYANTSPVGVFPKGASRYGLLDVVGNVWEWTADWMAPYDANPQKDPQGPTKGAERAVRGGAWNGAYPSWVRPTQRYSFPPETRSHAVGFRCATSIKEGT